MPGAVLAGAVLNAAALRAQAETQPMAHASGDWSRNASQLDPRTGTIGYVITPHAVACETTGTLAPRWHQHHIVNVRGGNRMRNVIESLRIFFSRPSTPVRPVRCPGGCFNTLAPAPRKAVRS